MACAAAEQGIARDLDKHKRALDISYELEIASEQRWDATLDMEPDDSEREQSAEFNLFLYYSITPQLTAVAEAKALLERQPVDSEDSAATRTEESLERGESWLRWQPDQDTGFAFTVGRQEIAEERQWWWDEDLDAARLDYLADSWGLSMAIAQELAPLSTLENEIHPAEKDVIRVLGQLSWGWRLEHRLDMFAFYQHDGSPTPRLGEPAAEADEVDADLAWLGLRASGALALGDYGSLNYRLDAAWVWGNEDRLGFEEEEEGLRVAEGRRRDVRGWALDLGAEWMLPVIAEPTLYLGYAIGSGDSNPADSTDRAFRQTGLQDGEDRFRIYGELFDPELSNLRIVTTGLSWPLFEDGVFALVYHRYWQVEASTELRETGIERDTDGENKALGWEWDLIFKLETDAGLSVAAVGSIFRAGRAFGTADGHHSYLAYVELTYEF